MRLKRTTVTQQQQKRQYGYDTRVPLQVAVVTVLYKSIAEEGFARIVGCSCSCSCDLVGRSVLFN